MERTAHRPRRRPSPRDDPAHHASAGRAAKCTRSAHRPAAIAQLLRAASELHRDRGRQGTQCGRYLPRSGRHHGYTGSYDAIKRFARKLRKREPKISCRFETEPGQEMQVDYGEGALTRDPRTGRYRRPRLFTLTLSNSRTRSKKRCGTRRPRSGAGCTKKVLRTSAASRARFASTTLKRA